MRPKSALFVVLVAVVGSLLTPVAVQANHCVTHNFSYSTDKARVVFTFNNHRSCRRSPRDPVALAASLTRDGAVGDGASVSRFSGFCTSRICTLTLELTHFPVERATYRGHVSYFSVNPARRARWSGGHVPLPPRTCTSLGTVGNVVGPLLGVPAASCEGGSGQPQPPPQPIPLPTPTPTTTTTPTPTRTVSGSPARTPSSGRTAGAPSSPRREAPRARTPSVRVPALERIR